MLLPNLPDKRMCKFLKACARRPFGVAVQLMNQDYENHEHHQRGNRTGDHNGSPKYHRVLIPINSCESIPPFPGTHSVLYEPDKNGQRHDNDNYRDSIPIHVFNSPLAASTLTD
jgi:hypothetical protein